jgi:hypothetical protein
LKKHWCIGTINGEYLARMEDILGLYELSYDANRPVVCFVCFRQVCVNRRARWG